MTIPDIHPVASLPWDAADPFPFYQRRRREGPVVWEETAGAWLILGYAPAQPVLREPGWTSNPLTNPNAPPALRSIDPDLVSRNILFSDGEDHRRLRHAVSDVFIRTFIAGLQAGIETTAEITTALRHLKARRPVLVTTPTWRNNPAVRSPHTMPTGFRR